MRNYKENPLKHGELIPKEELYNYYIMENHSIIETLQHFNITKTVLRRQLKKHGIKKPKTLCKLIREKTCLEKFGVKNIFEKTEYIKQKTKEKIGVENCSFLKETIEKRKQTCIKKFGGNAPACSKEVVQKTKRTNQERYSVNAPLCNPEIKEKMKKTNLEKYGVEFIGSCEEIRNKIKNTVLEKYNADNIMSSPYFREKSKNTCQEKYGVDNVCKSEQFRENVKRSCKERYGKEYYMETSEFREKSKLTNLKKFGYEHPNKNLNQINKIFNSKKNNNSYRKSKPEEEIYIYLKTKFSKIERQFNKDPRYPFPCDFYIPELDLFIEYQGYQGHGGHPFNPNDLGDKKKLMVWEQRSREQRLDGKTKSQYLDYIRIWTISDPIKRLYVLENNLNWIEFFNMKQFLTWYDLTNK